MSRPPVRPALVALALSFFVPALRAGAGDERTALLKQAESIIDELMEAGTYLCFGPDTLAEARNRGYRPFNGTGSD